MLIIKRNISTIATVDIDESTRFSRKLMSEHKITAQFISNTYLALELGDYIEHDGDKYYLNTYPEINKLNNITFEYSCEFESEIYLLYNKLFMYDRLSEFSYTGTASDFLTLIINQMNTISSGWGSGTVETTEEKTLTFSNSSCRQALTQVAEEFGLEYEISSSTISLQLNIGNATSNRFEYGKGKGLYQLTREHVSNKNVVTRVYGFGGSTNIPYGYRSRAKRLLFESKYLEANTNLYGVIEGQFTDDTIFPKRTSTLTNVNLIWDNNNWDQNSGYVEDSTIDFDINDYLIEGETARVIFKTGDLSGQEYEIWKYDHTNKRIYFNALIEEDGYTLPNTNNKPAIGDSYTLVNISMPQSYVDQAETALQAATQEYLNQNSTPQVTYKLFIDHRYVKNNNVSLHAGDIVNVVDTDLGIDTNIRVVEVSYPIVNPNKIEAVISDTVIYTTSERVIKDVVKQKREILTTRRESIELARRNTLYKNQLKQLIFDTDGYFDANNIKPLSIETLMLSVGAKSQNFRLNGVAIEANHQGDASKLYISSGQLNHLELNINGNCTWDVLGDVFEDLVSGTAYYIYAQCSKFQLTGDFIATTDQLQADGGSVYNCLLGVLYAEENGVRDYDLTNGMTYINGRTITTGKIKSIDGNNYMDLDLNRFRIGDNNSSLDWGVTAQGQLTIKGMLVQSPSGATFPATTFRGSYDANTYYYKGDEVTYAGSSWIYINPTSTKGNTPQDGTYYTKKAAKGTDGVDGQDGAPGADGQDGAPGPSLVFQGNYDAGKTYYGNSTRTDAVKYNNAYYRARVDAGTFSGQLPTNTSYWVSFGSQLESVATNLLLAESANIGNWIHNGGKIVSATSGDRIELDATNKKIQLLSTYAGGGYTYNSGMGCNLVLDAINGFIEARGANSGYTYDVSYISPSGIFSNNSNTRGLPVTAGVDQVGAIVGLGSGDLDKDPYTFFGNLLAGVYGRASNSGTAPTFGGAFFGLYAAGFTPSLTKILNDDGGITLSKHQTLIVGLSTAQEVIYLPPDAEEGTMVFVKQIWTGYVRVYPPTGQVMHDDASVNTYYDVPQGWIGIFFFFKNGTLGDVWSANRFKF